MKCYVCKREIDRSVRVFMEARDRRERAQFRDLCQACYETHMTEQGYVAERSESGLTVWAKLGVRIIDHRSEVSDAAQ